MRQRESKQFSQLLNRLREGNHTNDDIMKLKKRVIFNTTASDYPKHAPHLFIQNATVNDYNDKAHRAISGTKYCIKAHDSVIGAHNSSRRF